eukprot:477241_1
MGIVSSSSNMKEYDADDSIILKRGMLKKESRHKKTWRHRYTVLTYSKKMRLKSVYTFVDGDIHKRPTEAILDLDQYVIEQNNEYFCFIRHGTSFNFKCKTNKEATQWVNALKLQLKSGFRIMNASDGTINGFNAKEDKIIYKSNNETLNDKNKYEFSLYTNNSDCVSI